MTRFAQWLNDIRWARNMRQARRLRRGFGFSERVAFDRAIRPRIKTERGGVIDYPDAFYYVTADDIERALFAAAEDTLQRIARNTKAAEVTP